MRKKREAKIIPFKKDEVLFKSVNPKGEDLTIEKVRLLLNNDKLTDEEANHIIYSVTIFAEILIDYTKALKYYPESIENLEEDDNENKTKNAA